MSSEKEVRAKKAEELDARYGYINGHEHPERVHAVGFKVASGPIAQVLMDPNEQPCIVIGLDPYSPFGQILGRYVIPFSPDPDFSLNHAHLWIYRIDEDHVRIEVRCTVPRRYSDNDDQLIEQVYGIQIKETDRDAYLKIQE